MDLRQAITERHSVRKYTDKPIAEKDIMILQEAVQKHNAENGLHIQLVLDEPKAFTKGILNYGIFTGVRNYLVMAGPKDKTSQERIGYCGEKLVLLAQTLGLNTCWVGLTFKKIKEAFILSDGEKIHSVIALGYGENQGVQHPIKPVEKFCENLTSATLPEWFKEGVKAAILAPTAVNQQKFKFILHPDNKVEAKSLFSLIGYTHIDLGIAKCHFEIAAGQENFTWR